MKVKEFIIKYQYIFMMFLGILIGTCYANIMNEFCLSWDVFNSNYLSDYNDITVNSVILWQYVVKNRGRDIIIILLLGLTRFRKLFLSVYLLYIGACVGVLMCIAIMRFGALGLLIYVASIMPHYILYAVAIYVLYNILLRKMICRKNKFILLMITFLLILLGTYLEAYVNPLIIKKLYVILY